MLDSFAFPPLVAVDARDPDCCADRSMVAGEVAVTDISQLRNLLGHGDVVDPGAVAVLLLQ